MRLVKYLLLLFVFSYVFINSAFATVKVGVTHWVDYTNPDETGVYIELLKEVYADEQLEFDFSTYKRITNLFEQKQYDIVVGVAKEDIPLAYYPNWYLDYDYPINAYFVDSAHKFNKLSDLNNKVLSWLDGYNFDKFIEYPHDYYPASTIENAVALLLNKRIDAFVDFDYNIPKEYKSKLNYVEVVPARPIYLAFSNNEKGKALARRFDQTMPKLKSSGRLQALYKSDYENTRFAEFDANKTKIVLSSNDESLLRLNSVTEGKSLDAQLYKLILAEMRDYRIEFVKASDTNAEVQFGISHCFANKINTSERASRYLISKPFSLYLAPRLYSPNSLAQFKHIKNLDELVSQSELRLGLSKFRIFSEDIMSLLEEVDKTKIKPAPTNIFSRLQQLAKLQEFDASIEYPSDVATYWHDITDADIHSFDLKLKTSFTVGHLMCERSEENIKFMQDFNNTLSKLIQSDEYKALIYHFAADLPAEQFNKIYQQALLGEK